MPIPCVISPTPKELAAATQQAREATFGMKSPLTPPRPPPGAIRVEFYSHMYKVIRGTDPDMSANVILEHNGDLDVNKLCKMWGLENCLAIDPQRWTVQRRVDETKLSGVAVHVLSNGFKRAIMFTELPVSKQTERIRTTREIGLNIGNACSLTVKLFFDLLMDLFNCCTPIPYWYRKTHFYYTHIDWVRYRRNLKFTAIALNNDLTVKRSELQTSAQGYVSEKRGTLGRSYKKCRRWCVETAQDWLYELSMIGSELLRLLRLAMFIIIPIFVLYLMLPLIQRWERERMEKRWQREIQLVFQ